MWVAWSGCSSTRAWGLLQYDLHRPVVWTYLWSLAQRGLIKLIVGGPPCRTVSRLRGGPPGPRKVRGRGVNRHGVPDAAEQELAEGDTCLLLKQLALWRRTEQARAGQGWVTGFLLETPQDPASYLLEEEGADCPSFLEFPEVKSLVEKEGIHELGHQLAAHGGVTPVKRRWNHWRTERRSWGAHQELKDVG